VHSVGDAVLVPPQAAELKAGHSVC
jgi:hypothetical protein